MSSIKMPEVAHQLKARSLHYRKMARKKFSKRKEETRVSFTFQSLHQEVMNAVSDEIASMWFNENDTDEDLNNGNSTFIMGTFKCNNNACSGTDKGLS
jgi:hypothetical protein